MTSSPIFSLSDAVGVVEGYFVKDAHDVAAQNVFEDQLKNVPQNDHEKRGDCYYYLLRLLFKGHMPFEHPIAKTYYDHMTEHFVTVERAYKFDINRESDHRKRSVKLSQLKAFYKLMERYYSSLESLYSQNGFIEAKDRAFYQKMLFRKDKFLAERQFSLYLGYTILQISSKYGLSVQRWGITTFVSVFIFSLLFYIIDVASLTKMVPDATSYNFNYIYLSVVNFTTLGFGDYLPHTDLQKFITCVEVLMGYTMLGMFVNILFKRF